MIVRVIVLRVIVSVRMRALLGYVQMRGGEAGPQHALDVQLAVDAQAAERPPYLIGRQAGIDQRSEDHVPGRARRTLEIHHTGH